MKARRCGRPDRRLEVHHSQDDLDDPFEEVRHFNLLRVQAKRRHTENQESHLGHFSSDNNNKCGHTKE